MNLGPRSAQAPPIINIIDADETVLATLKLALEIEGFAVRAYSTWTGVFENADFIDGACMIIDQELPGLDGLELVAALRIGRIAAPVVLVADHASELLQERAARAGIPIVEKPLLASTLLDCVRDAVQRQTRRH